MPRANAKPKAEDKAPAVKKGDDVTEEAKPNAKAKPKAQAKPSTKAKAKAQAKPSTKAKAKAEAKPKPNKSPKAKTAKPPPVPIVPPSQPANETCARILQQLSEMVRT